jgi:hypothetical protein
MTDTGVARALARILPDRPGRGRPAIVAGLAALVLALTPAPARASGGLTVTSYVFPSIVVVGNGHRYTHVSAIGYAYEIGVDITTGTSGRIKEWQVWPTLTVEGQPTFDLKVYGHREWYPSASDPWPRPKSKKRQMVLLFPDVLIKDYVVSACNRNADQLRKMGQSDAKIFSQPHQIPATTSPVWKLDFTVGGDSSSETFFPIPADLVCAAWAGIAVPPPKAGNLAVPMEVKQSGLVVFPSQHDGVCPAQLSLFGRVTGNAFGTFESWLESTEGWKSTKTKRTVHTKADGQYEEQFIEKITVPIVRPADKPGGGPASGQVAGGGALKGQKAPPDPVGPPRSTPPVGGSGSITTGKAPNVHQAALRLVATGGGKTVASPWHDYTVTCDPKVAPGLTPFDALAAAVTVTQSSLAVSPRTNPLGKCEVELQGRITTNVALADVTLAYRNHKDVTTPPREVTTGANREATFSDTLDFWKTTGGLWIEQGGVIGPGGDQSGPYSGSFRIVGQSVSFESSAAPYDFTCTGQAPGALKP